MAKIKLNYYLYNEEETKGSINGILEDKKIKYNDGMINILDLNEYSLKRFNSEYNIDMKFDENNITQGKYVINNMVFDIEVKTYYIKHGDNYFEVKYKVNDIDVLFKIDWRIL